MFIILYIVFVKFIKLGEGIPHYPVYLLLGIVLWNFFSEMTSQSLSSIVGRGDIIRKVSVPHWVIVFSSSLAAVINLILNLFVVMLFMAITNVPFQWSILLLPIFLIEIYIFSLGLSLILATAYVKYRDISYIWEVILQAAFYLTPILYPITLITSLAFQKLMLLNPMAQAIQDARYVTVTEQTITTSQIFNGEWPKIIPYIICIVVLILGVLYFRRESKNFAENI